MVRMLQAPSDSGHSRASPGGLSLTNKRHVRVLDTAFDADSHERMIAIEPFAMPGLGFIDRRWHTPKSRSRWMNRNDDA